MKKSHISLATLSILGSLLLGCGAGDNNSDNQKIYYSAAHSGYYVIESGVNPNNESQLYFSVVAQSGGYVQKAPLTMSSHGNYTFNQSNVIGTVTIKDSLLGVSYTAPSNSWIDLATSESHILSSVSTGNFNLICDQTNLSACNLQITNNQITITEYSITGQATTLCSNSSLTKVPQNFSNPYLYSFNCGVNGGSSSGTWYVLPFNKNGESSIMISEFNPTSNDNSDATDELAFKLARISPSGEYKYLYNGGSISGVGVSTVSINQSGLINPVSGLCGGSSCALIQDQYYIDNQAVGFSWYNVNLQNNYNFTGSDIMKVYQDSFEGFYF